MPGVIASRDREVGITHYSVAELPHRLLAAQRSVWIGGNSHRKVVSLALIARTPGLFLSQSLPKDRPWTARVRSVAGL